VAIEWYLNKYECERCSYYWEDEWSCTCDDRCPECNCANSPFDSEDLSTELVEADYLLMASAMKLTPGLYDGNVDLAHDGARLGAVWIQARAAELFVQQMKEGKSPWARI
jgi:hypothetical protein